MISTTAAARLLGLTPRRLQRLCHEGRVPGAVKRGSVQSGYRWELPDNPTVTPGKRGPALCWPRLLNRTTES